MYPTIGYLYFSLLFFSMNHWERSRAVSRPLFSSVYAWMIFKSQQTAEKNVTYTSSLLLLCFACLISNLKGTFKVKIINSHQGPHRACTWYNTKLWRKLSCWALLLLLLPPKHWEGQKNNTNNWTNILTPRFPQFLYFHSFLQMYSKFRRVFFYFQN